MQYMTDVHSTTSTDNCNHICVDSLDLQPVIEDIINSIDIKTITLSMVSKKFLTVEQYTGTVVILMFCWLRNNKHSTSSLLQ